MKIIFLSFCFVLPVLNVQAQSKEHYEQAFNEISQMLKGESPLDFKRAVFLTENAFRSNKLDYKIFCRQIDKIEFKIIQLMLDKGIGQHPMGKQFAIFSYMMEASKYNGNIGMTYNFEDWSGKNDWTNMFVTKLLETKKGNCHSLPYLYKILAEGLKAEAYLALAPNHIYIKHKDDKGQWANVELTNKSFPRDAWIMSSLSVSTDAIKKETYMEPLTLKESVAHTLYDLAMDYQRQFGYDDFGIKCCNALIEYFPNCITAYMIMSKTFSEKYKTGIAGGKDPKGAEVAYLQKSIKKLNDQIVEMGYADMPKEQYEQWVKDVEKMKQEQNSKK